MLRSAVIEPANPLYRYRDRVPEPDRRRDLLAEAVESLVLLLAPLAPVWPRNCGRPAN